MFIQSIQGQKDPVVQRLRNIEQNAAKEQDFYLIESLELVKRALTYGAILDSLFLSDGLAQTVEGLELVREAKVPSYKLSTGLFAKMLPMIKPAPQCVAIAKRQIYQAQDFWKNKNNPLILAVDEGENADNLGMLLRSAEAAGVDGVILGNGTVSPFGFRVVRGSRGAVFHLPIAIVDSLATVLDQAKQDGLEIVGSSANVEEYYLNADFKKRMIMIVGNEHRGMSPAVKQRCTQLYKIPMLGKINSLNISVAASIFIFEAQRQRMHQA